VTDRTLSAKPSRPSVHAVRVDPVGERIRRQIAHNSRLCKLLRHSSAPFRRKIGLETLCAATPRGHLQPRAGALGDVRTPTLDRGDKSLLDGGLDEIEATRAKRTRERRRDHGRVLSVHRYSASRSTNEQKRSARSQRLQNVANRCPETRRSDDDTVKGREPHDRHNVHRQQNRLPSHRRCEAHSARRRIARVGRGRATLPPNSRRLGKMPTPVTRRARAPTAGIEPSLATAKVRLVCCTGRRATNTTSRDRPRPNVPCKTTQTGSTTRGDP
jgi:hypothetical protein